MEKFTFFTKELEELFPASQAQMQTLCKNEEMPIFKEGDGKSLQLVQEASEADKDEILERAARDEVVARGHKLGQVESTEQSHLRVGDNNTGAFVGLRILAHDVERAKSSGKSTLWVGNANQINA